MLRNELLRERYAEFMNKYLNLEQFTRHNSYLLYALSWSFAWGHFDYKKLHVLFNASALSSNGLSLNNIQMVGPVLQVNLLSFLLRFWIHTYVIPANIAKMYRIWTCQHNLQKIIWWQTASDVLDTYVLKTVIYGQARAIIWPKDVCWS